MSDTGATTGSAKMRPRARLIGLIGDELISDEPVAVVELVKNAYDADARTVEVRFDGKEPTRPERIIVTDDGIGMDLKTVLTGWFEPGTILKRRQECSPGGRLYQGAKGIGRFAAARLARSLFLESKRNDGRDAVVVLIDWGKFDNESYLDEITIDYEVRPVHDLQRGTRLTLETLRKDWVEDECKELHTRLSRLVSPFADIKDFSILLEIPTHPELSGEVLPPDLTLKPRYLLRGDLEKDGTFSGELLFEGRIHEKFKARKLGDAEEATLCGPFHVEIRAWDRDREGLDPIAEKWGMSVKEIRDTLDAYCGVSIYRDGFRVHPYGETGSDWLNLDLRSRLKPGERLANNQIIAAIRISRESNPGLKDRSTREGMVYNAVHANLEKWFTEILTLLEAARYELRPREKPADQVDPLFEAFDLTVPLRRAQSELGAKHPVTRLISKTSGEVKEAVERVQTVFSRLLTSAGLGHMIDIVIHEIGSPLGKANRQLAVLERDLETLLHPDHWKRISPMVDSIKAWLEQIHNLRERLEPQTPAKRGRTTSFDVREEIEDNFNLYEALIKRQNITYEIRAPRRPLIVKMSRAALGQIMANLIDNAIFWITRKKGAGKGGRIRVHVEPLKHGFQLLISDDGPGVPETDRIKIFEPYFTRKPNGMGLGLYIARLVIEPYGKLLYRPEHDLSGACFEAVFERRVGL
jgi:signal transduction histidine kinase